VRLRHGGRLYADGFVDQRNNRDARQIDHPLLGRYFESYDGRRYHLRDVH